jgi:hypothetical protein
LCRKRKNPLKDLMTRKKKYGYLWIGLKDILVFVKALISRGE